MLGLIAQMGMLGLTACIFGSLISVGIAVIGTIVSGGIAIDQGNKAADNARKQEALQIDNNNKAQALARARARAADIANKKNLKKAQYQAVSATTLNRVITDEARYKTARLNRETNFHKQMAIDTGKPSVRISGFTYSRGAPVGK